jgi:hypothetical protein
MEAAGMGYEEVRGHAAQPVDGFVFAILQVE